MKEAGEHINTFAKQNQSIINDKGWNCLYAREGDAVIAAASHEAFNQR